MSKKLTDKKKKFFDFEYDLDIGVETALAFILIISGICFGYKGVLFEMGSCLFTGTLILAFKRID